eukprot:sb/3463982/
MEYVYYVEEAQLADAGTYQCLAAYKADPKNVPVVPQGTTKSDQVAVVVLGLSTQPTEQHIGVGSDVTITAVFKGDAPATQATWESRASSVNGEVSTDPWTVLTISFVRFLSPKYPGKSGSDCSSNNMLRSFQIYDVDDKDERDYRVKAVYATGTETYKVISKAISINIKYEKLTTEFGLAGQTSQMTCFYERDDNDQQPQSMEFLTGDASTLNNPWNAVSGARFSTSALVKINSVWQSILTITETTVADEKDYKCRVTLTKKQAEDSEENTVLDTDVAKLYVIQRLESPLSNFYSEGDETTLSCKFKGNNKAVQMEWYKSDDQGLNYKLFTGEAGRISLSDVEYSATAFTSQSKVNFLKLVADDTGYYKCNVKYIYTYGTEDYSKQFDSEIGETYIVSFQTNLVKKGNFILLHDSFSLSVVTKGPNQPTGTSWEFDVDDITNTTKTSTLVSGSGGYVIETTYEEATLQSYSTLTMSKSTVESRGEYSVCETLGNEVTLASARRGVIS